MPSDITSKRSESLALPGFFTVLLIKLYDYVNYVVDEKVSSLSYRDTQNYPYKAYNSIIGLLLRSKCHRDFSLKSSQLTQCVFVYGKTFTVDLL